MTELVNKKPEETIPSFLLNERNKGIEDLSQSDINIPRIKIKQSTSRTDMPGVQDGDFYSPQTKINFGKEIIFVPISLWKSTVWFSKDFKQMATLSVIGGKEHKFESEEGYIAAHKQDGRDQLNYFVVTKDIAMSSLSENTTKLPYILSLGSGAMKEARNLNTMLYNSKIPIYGKFISAKTRKITFSRGDAWIPYFEQIDIVKDEKLFNVLKDMAIRANEIRNQNNTIEEKDFE